MEGYSELAKTKNRVCIYASKNLKWEIYSNNLKPLNTILSISLEFFNKRRKLHSRPRRLGSNVVDHPVNTLDLYDISALCSTTPFKERPTHLVGNSRRDPLQHLRGEHEPVGSHEVFCRDGPNRNDLVICPRVTSNTNGLDRQEGNKGLRDLIVQTSSTNFLNVNVVGVLEDRDLLASDLAENSDSETRTGERVSAD